MAAASPTPAATTVPARTPVATTSPSPPSPFEAFAAWVPTPADPLRPIRTACAIAQIDRIWNPLAGFDLRLGADDLVD